MTAAEFVEHLEKSPNPNYIDLRILADLVRLWASAEAAVEAQHIGGEHLAKVLDVMTTYVYSLADRKL